jgi:hypothetical protein
MEYSPSGSVSISVLFAMEHQDGAKKRSWMGNMNTRMKNLTYT